MSIPAAAPADTTTPPAVVPPATPAVPAVPPVVPSIGAAPVVPDVPAVVPPVVPPATPSAFEPSGDAGLDLAANWVLGLGIPADDPAIVAALEEGNFDFLKAKLATFGDKARGWEQYVALAEKGVTNLRTAADAAATATNTIVYEAVGGEEAWGKIAEWAGANAEPEEKEGINAMLAAGGVQARAAAAFLQGLYNSASGTVVEPQAATVAAPASRANSTSALSPSEYSNAVSELASRIGAHRMDGSQEYAALKQRRLAYKG